MSLKKFFTVVVRGQYHALNDASGMPTLKNYEASFVLPSQEAALATICKHLLTPALKKKYPDFIRYRTHELVSITLSGHKPNPNVLQMSIEDMGLSQLFDFTVLKGIMIDPYKHNGTIESIREKIAAEWRTRRLSVEEAKKSGAEKEQKEKNALRELNDLPPAAEGIELNINEQKVSRTAQPVKEAPVSSLEAASDEEESGPLPDFENDNAAAIE